MRFIILALMLILGVGAHVASSATVSFQDSYQYPTPKPGWSYLWNSSGPIGDPANYSPLMSGSGLYSSTGSSIPTPSPAAFLNFSVTEGLPGGHPGEAPLQGGSGGIERYAIAAYSIAEPATGVSLANGWLRNANPNATGSTDGLNLKVFVNDESSPRISMTTAPGTGSIVEFGAALGDLQAGATVYVAVGGVNDDSYDGFQLRYELVGVPEPIVPEPAAAALMVIAIVFGGMLRTCRHRVTIPRRG